MALTPKKHPINTHEKSSPAKPTSCKFLVAGAGFEPTTSGHPFQILVSRGHTLYHPSSNPIFDQNSVTRYHGKSQKIMLIHITIQITSNP